MEMLEPKDLIFKIVATLLCGIFLFYFKQLVESVSSLNVKMAEVLTHLQNHKEMISRHDERLLRLEQLRHGK